jgi:hypothetical protein
MQIVLAPVRLSRLLSASIGHTVFILDDFNVSDILSRLRY